MQKSDTNVRILSFPVTKTDIRAKFAKVYPRLCSLLMARIEEEDIEGDTDLKRYVTAVEKARQEQDEDGQEDAWAELRRIAAAHAEELAEELAEVEQERVAPTHKVSIPNVLPRALVTNESLSQHPLFDLQDCVDKAISHLQPRLKPLMEVRTSEDATAAEKMTAWFLAEYWDGKWLTEEEYGEFIYSPAVQLFPLRQFREWGISLRFHGSYLMPWRVDEKTFSAPKTSRPGTYDSATNGVEHIPSDAVWENFNLATRFRMRLVITSDPLPLRRDASAPLPTWTTDYRIAETVRDRREAISVLPPESAQCHPFPLQSVRGWHKMPWYEGAHLSDEDTDLYIENGEMEGGPQVLWAYPDTVSFVFATQARAVAEHFGWRYVEACRFVATGVVPHHRPILIHNTVASFRREGARGRIQLSVDPAVPTRALAHIHDLAKQWIQEEDGRHQELFGGNSDNETEEGGAGRTRIQSPLAIAVIRHVQQELLRRGIEGNPNREQLRQCYKMWRWPEGGIQTRTCAYFTRIWKRAQAKGRMRETPRQPEDAESPDFMHPDADYVIGYRLTKVYDA